MYIYCDETGNTGNNLFDRDQPIYILCGVVAPIEIDAIADEFYKKVSEKSNFNELHSAEMGIDEIELIAPELIDFINKYNIGILFSVVDKKHLNNIKLVDFLLDNYQNPAFSAIDYNFPHMRLMITQTLIQSMNTSISEKFYHAFKKKNISSFTDVLEELKKQIENDVPDKKFRKRLVDGIQYAIENPDQILTWKQNKNDSPNIVAFTGLLNSVNQISELYEVKVARFIHDEQKEFSGKIKEMYNFLKDILFEDPPFNTINNVRNIVGPEKDIEIIDSKNSFGIQLADIFLWVSKYSALKDISKYPSVVKLHDVISERFLPFELTPRQLYFDATNAYKSIMSLDVSDLDLKKGEELLKEIEKTRVKPKKEY